MDHLRQRMGRRGKPASRGALAQHAQVAEPAEDVPGSDPAPARALARPAIVSSSKEPDSSQRRCDDHAAAGGTIARGAFGAGDRASAARAALDAARVTGAAL